MRSRRNSRIPRLIAGAALLLLPALALTDAGFKLKNPYFLNASSEMIPAGTLVTDAGKVDGNGNRLVSVPGAETLLSVRSSEGGGGGLSGPMEGQTGEQEECEPNQEIPKPPVSTEPVSPGGGKIPGTAREVGRIADEARGVELIDHARAARSAVQDAALSDYGTLGQSYLNLPFEALGQRMQEAVENLSESFQVLDSATDGILPAERMRFRNVMLNARDKAALAFQVVSEEKQNERILQAVSPFSALLKGQVPNPLARNQALGGIFGDQKLNAGRAATPDGLSNRYVMLAGLPKTEQEKALSKLKLVETPELSLRSGEKKKLPLLHNGYFLGGGVSSVDCSSFVSALLSPEGRKTRYTTLDLMAVWRYRKFGEFPNPPKFEPKRMELLRKAADAFVAVDLYAGEKPRVGDLLVYRQAWDPSGHVFMVTAYDPVAMRAEVIDASLGTGTVKERPFPLTADPMGAPERFIRPGLHVLRMKPVSSQACAYRDSAKPGKGLGKGGVK